MNLEREIEILKRQVGTLQAMLGIERPAPSIADWYEAVQAFARGDRQPMEDYHSRGGQDPSEVEWLRWAGKNLPDPVHAPRRQRSSGQGMVCR